MARPKSSASAHEPHQDTDHNQEQERPCFYCLEGWVFLGSIDYNGEEVYEAIRCRRCKGMGVLK